MKKALASTVAAIMALSMMTACGDSSSDTSKAEETTTTTTAAETEAAENEAAESEAPKEDAEGDTESEGDTEGGDGANDTSGNWQALDKIKDSLQYYDDCSMKFAADTDVNAFAEMFDEMVGTSWPGDPDYTGDEAILDLSVQDVGGIPMMRVDQLLYTDGGGNTVPKGIKLRFDMNKLFAGHEDELANIFTIKADVVIIAREPAIFDGEDTNGGVGVYWYGGAIGTNNDGVWNGNLLEYSTASLMSQEGDATEWINQWAYVPDMMIRPGIQDEAKKATFSADYETNYLTLMAWTNGATYKNDMYVADFRFEDADGNVIAVPEENLPGGATYEADNLVDATEDGIVPRDESGMAVYDEDKIQHFSTVE